MKDFSMYKYFKGEPKNPLSENDLLASKWWNGERLFYENAQSKPHFIDIIRKQLKEAIETNNVSSILVDETVDINRRILIFYLDLWHSKWFPYDNFDAIFKY